MAFTTDLLSRCWILTGPTASGKTAVSLELAELLNAEIVALDSMTLYRGMDIGTAKPSPEELSHVRHHLIDLLDPNEEFSLASYVEVAETACRDIVSRGRTPLFVGGSGLYLKGILRGVFEGPAADRDLRRRFEIQAEREGSQSLWNQLHEIDPQSATRLHPNDQRRVIRALEVHQLTGQPLSALQTQGARPVHERPKCVCWVSPPRDWLYSRIDQRVEQMFTSGLVGEVQTLMNRTQGLSHTARQALGYKEVIDWLESQPSQQANDRPVASDREGFDKVLNLIQTRTRQFAKRQHTWFRNLEECTPLAIRGTESPLEIARFLLSQATS